ncbi:DUF6463 family protein [Actinomadura sediminis]|uniref:DUF6463 family protein n=1 Tax=Actinomadura sediminis TaxID=1038904 RepID=A0ABW3EQA4_9ACTN
MSALARWTPRLIIATALLHFGWAFAQPNAWADIAGDGFVRTAVDTDAPGYFEREASIWFMSAGIALLAIGTLTRHVLRATGRLPAQVGWYLLALGVPMCAIYFPVTGSWALLIIGLLALYAARRPAPADRRRDAQEPRAPLAEDRGTGVNIGGSSDGSSAVGP